MMMLLEPKRPKLSCSDVPRRPRHGLNRHARRNLHPRHDLHPRHGLNRTACRALRRPRLELSQGLLPPQITLAPGRGGEATNNRLLFHTPHVSGLCAPCVFAR